MNISSFVKSLREHVVNQWDKSRLKHIDNLTKEEWDEDLNQNFDYAKKMSDFIGFIIRWAFLNFSLLYFLDKASKEKNFFLGSAFWACFTAVFIFQLKFSIKIYAIIQSYWNADTARVNGLKAIKYVLYFFAFLQALLLFVGTSTLVREVGRSSALLSK